MQHAALPCSYTTRRARDGEQLFCAQFLLFHSKYAPITRWRKSILFGTLLVLAGHANESQFLEERVGPPSSYYVLSASTIGLHLAAQKRRARPSRESSRPPAPPALLCYERCWRGCNFCGRQAYYLYRRGTHANNSANRAGLSAHGLSACTGGCHPGSGETCRGGPGKSAQCLEQEGRCQGEGHHSAFRAKNARGELRLQAHGRGPQLRPDHWTPGGRPVPVLLARARGEESRAGHRAHQNIQSGSDRGAECRVCVLRQGL